MWSQNKVKNFNHIDSVRFSKTTKGRVSLTLLYLKRTLHHIMDKREFPAGTKDIEPILHVLPDRKAALLYCYV